MGFIVSSFFLNRGNFKIFIFEKDSPTKKEGTYKDGFHIYYPYLPLNITYRYLLYDTVLNKLKQTEIGMLPEDWNVKPLSEVITIIGGGTPKTTNTEYWGGVIPWISVVDFVGDNRWIHQTEKTITKRGLEESSTKLLHEGQLII